MIIRIDGRNFTPEDLLLQAQINPKFFRDERGFAEIYKVSLLGKVLSPNSSRAEQWERAIAYLSKSPLWSASRGAEIIVVNFTDLMEVA